MVAAFTMLYISSFANLFDPHQGTDHMETETKRKLVFIFFWSGTYSDAQYESYLHSSYTYYILLLLLVIERMCQMWMEDKFGCSEEMEKIYAKFEKQDKILQNMIKEQKKNRRSVMLDGKSGTVRS